MLPTRAHVRRRYFGPVTSETYICSVMEIPGTGRQPTSENHQHVLQIAGAFVAATVVLGTTFLVWHYLDTFRARNGQEDAFCCPDLVRRLWEASNTSVDPCRNFYQYSCYNWDFQEGLSRLDRGLLLKVTVPTFTGVKKSRAAKAISAYYWACHGASLDEDRGMEKAVRCLVDALLPPALPTPRGMFSLLCRATLRYGMEPGIVVSRTWMTLANDNILGWTDGEGVSRRKRGIAIFNDAMAVNVSWEGVHGLATAAFVQHGGTTDIYRSSFNVITSIVPNVSVADWQRMVRENTGYSPPTTIRHNDVSLLRKYFDVVMNGAQPASLALLIVEAAASSWETLWEGSASTQQFDMHNLCMREAQNLKLLWDVAAIETFTDSYKDSIVRGIYRNMSQRAIIHAASLFPPEDVAIMLQRYSKYRLFLASEVHARDIEPPLDTFDFWKKKLALKDYVLAVRIHQQQHGVPYYPYGIFRKDIAYVVGQSRLVSAALYAYLNFTAISDPEVNVPVVGPRLSPWKIILKEPGDYSPNTTKVIERSEKCGSERDVYWRYRLDLETAVNVSRSGLWEKKLHSWGTRRISRGQVFYMNYALNFLCGSLGEFPEQEISNIQKLMMGIPDFQRVFKCSTVPDNDTDYCSLKRSSQEALL